MSRLEKSIEEECCRIAWQKYGLLSLKQDTSKGLPDRLFFNRKKKKTTAFFVEFKRVGQSSKKYQVYVQSKLRESGVSVYKDIDNEENFCEICETELRS